VHDALRDRGQHRRVEGLRWADGWRRAHKTVDHSGPKSTWARDDDGHGVREAHCNTQEGLWVHVRDFLRRS
jgi:hypothetical protein